MSAPKEPVGAVGVRENRTSVFLALRAHRRKPVYAGVVQSANWIEVVAAGKVDSGSGFDLVCVQGVGMSKFPNGLTIVSVISCPDAEVTSE